MLKKLIAARILLASIFVAGLLGYASPSGVNAASTSQVPGEGWAQVKPPVPEQASGPLAPMPAPDLAGVKPDDSQTTSSNLSSLAPSPGRSALAASTDLVIFQNAPLVPTAPAPIPQELASPVFANVGLDVFGTYDKGAALSLDYGDTWFYIDPTSMTTGAGTSWELHGGFAGNQDVLYDASRNLMVWVLQYAPDSTGNAIRVAWTTGNAAGLESNAWLSTSLEPTPFCGGAGNPNSRFDRVQLARTSNYLYLAANVYDSAAAFLCTTMIRIPLTALAAGAFDPSVFYSHVGFNFTPAQGGTSTLYFARHEDGTHLRLYDWAESLDPTDPGAVMPSTTVLHGAYASTGYSCPVSGVNPCGADDDRLTTGWMRRANNELGFMWDAAQDGSHTYPYVKILTMDAATKTVISDTQFASSSFAWFLASSSVNARGHVAGTLARAGGSTYPSCSAWIYDDISSLSDFANISAVTGNTNPGSNHWGSYLRTRTNWRVPLQWIGSCYAIEGGVVKPRVITFGRLRDAANLQNGDTVGVFRPSNGALYLKNTNATGIADAAFTYGLPGDYPVVGDWDGNGTTTLGIYRGDSFFLRNTNTDGFADLVFAFGAPGDQPLAGDWNGDGIDTVGIYRSSIGAFFLRNSNSSGAPDITFTLGIPGDVGIAGDWNGDLIETTGVFRPSNGALYLKNTNSTGFADIVATYGIPGDKPVTGDWNNDGIDSIGVYRGDTFYLRDTNDVGFANYTFTLGIASDMPISGNWDGLWP